MKKYIIIFITIIIGLAGIHTGIFWDNVTFVSEVGNVLYQKGLFAWGDIPVYSDSGHPPFIGTLMALCWQLFGRSLLVSHLVLWPFIFGILWFVWSLCSYFLKDFKLVLLSFLLIVADATILSQLTLVSQDVLVLFFALSVLNGILYDNKWQKNISLAFLGLTSLRGMMLCGGFFLLDICLNKKLFFTKQNVFSYAIGAIPAILYIVWRLCEKGWIISNPMQTWGDAVGYESTGHFFSNFCRNTIILIHRFVDFGRIIPISIIIITLLRHRICSHIKYQLLCIIFLSTIIVYTTSLIILNPMGHRYFMVSYIGIWLLSFICIQQYKYHKQLYALLIMSSVIGHLIIYPERISQGWDSSLAHLHYWQLRKNSIQYMDNHDIPFNKTATFFPNGGTIDNIDLNGDMRSFADYNTDVPYIFYSNVYNLPDETLNEIKQHFTIEKSFDRMGVTIKLYKNKKYNPQTVNQ